LLGDVLETLFFSLDEDFRKTVREAIDELESRPSHTPSDWRASLAAMPD
jgi:hypothetical protein